MNKIKVLMVGPARDVKGGMTTVVNGYFENGLNKKVELRYIESATEGRILTKYKNERRGIKEYKKCIDEYDIVHIHMASNRSTYRKIKYIYIAKKHNKKVVLHIHGGGFKDFFNKQTPRNKKYIINSLAKADSVIVLSSQWKNYFDALLEMDTVVINNAVKIEELPKKNWDNSLLYLGRINKAKGIYDLIDSMAALKRNGFVFKLYVAGAGDDEKVSEIIHKLGLESNITMLGWLGEEEKKKYLRSCSYIVLPSYFEGMPMAVLEGMSYGCIPITTMVGGLGDIITDGVNGFEIEPGKPDNICKKIIEAIKMSDEKKNRMSKMARHRIKTDYDSEIMTEKILDVYAYVLGVEKNGRR